MGADEMTAADRLRTLSTHYRTPVRGATSVRAAPSVLPATPVNVGMLDYLEKTVAEIRRHAGADAHAAVTADPAARILPRPADPAALYAWWESIPISDQAREDDRARIICRQTLEHAIKEGDTAVIRRHPCPSCGCYSLFWQPMEHKAICPNRHCTDTRGVSRLWSLAAIADHHILAQRSLKNSATS